MRSVDRNFKRHNMGRELNSKEEKNKRLPSSEINVYLTEAKRNHIK